MRLTIDTKMDSKDEIRKAIRLLMGLVGNGEVYTNDVTEESKNDVAPSPMSDAPSMSGLMSLFDNPPSEPAVSTIQKSEENASQVVKDEKDESIPKIEFY